MTERRITPKSLMRQAVVSKSAIGFLAQYREYMTTGELASVLSPIVSKIDAGILLPTPGMKEIANAVLTHILTTATAKAEASSDASAKTGSTKQWITTIFDAKGTVCTRINSKGEEEDLVKGFDKNADAQRWADRRLALDGEPGWYADTLHTPTDKHVFVQRDDALYRFHKQPKGPTCQVKGRSTKTLGFQSTMKQTRVSFSRG